MQIPQSVVLLLGALAVLRGYLAEECCADKRQVNGACKRLGLGSGKVDGAHNDAQLRVDPRTYVGEAVRATFDFPLHEF